MKKHRILFVLCAFGFSLYACSTPGGESSVSSQHESSVEVSSSAESSIASSEGSSSISSESVSVAPSFEASFYEGFSTNYSVKVTKGEVVEESVFTDGGVYHKASDDGVIFVEENAYSFAKSKTDYVYSDGAYDKESTLLSLSASEYKATYDASHYFASASLVYDSESESTVVFASSGESDQVLKFACVVAGLDEDSSSHTKVEVKDGKVHSISVVSANGVLASLEFSEIGTSVLAVDPILYIPAVTEGGEAGKDDGASEEFVPNTDPEEPEEPETPVEGEGSESIYVSDVNVTYTYLA